MQQLLKHFHELSLHPKNAKELKGLILQLALQGKLTADWRNRHPDLISGSNSAENLLKKIKAVKAQLVKEKKITKEKALPLTPKKEIPYDIPESWIWSRLLETGYTQTGTTPPKKNPEYYGKFIPFIGPAHISNYGIKYPSEGLSKKGLEKGRLITSDSLMMVCIGGSIGKCYVNDINVSCNQQINTVTTLSSPIKFILYVCQSHYFQKSIFLKSSGSATPIINKGKWESIPVPFPTLEEQKAIVKIVENLFKEVEELEDLTKKRITLKKGYASSALSQLAKNNSTTEWMAIKPNFHEFFNEVDNIKKLRETILQLAVQGKLTAKWRAENPELISEENSSEKLLKEINAEKTKLINEKKIKKEKALPSIDDEDKSVELPKEWVWCRLNNALRFIDYRGKTPKKISSGVRLLTAKNVRPGYLKISPEEFMSEDEYNQWMTRGFPEKGDLLFTTEAPLGNVCQLELDEKVGLAQRIITLQPYSSRINKKYMMYCLMSPLVQQLIVDKATGMTAQGIKASKLKLIPFPLPPHEEQNFIAHQVSALMNLCDQLKKEVKSGQEQIEDLMQSVLKEVFEEKAVKTEIFPIASEPEVIYGEGNSSFDEIFESLNFDYEVAAVVLLTQERFGFTYGKKYVHKMFSNIDFLHELPICSELQFQEHGWGMYSPILQKTLENEIFITYQYLDNNKRTLLVKPKAISQIRKWVKANENKQFVNQVKQMLNIYEQPLIDLKMDRIELFNTVLECMMVLKTDILKDIRAKMKNWKMFEGYYNTKAEKFSENETLHMIHFIKSISLK